MNQDCIFCKIIAREIPSVIFYETESVVAFLNINPVNPGHFMVLPKKHSVNILDTDDQLLAEIAIAVKKLTPAVMEVVGAQAFNLEVNNGKVSGQEIMHAHWHVVPRFESDGLEHWKGKPITRELLEVEAEKIRKII